MNLNNNMTITYQDEKEELYSHDKYQESFLDFFFLKEYDEPVIGKQVDYLFNAIKENEKWLFLLEECAKYYNVDKDSAIIYFFNFDMFNVSYEHMLKYILANTEIPESSYNKILEQFKPKENVDEFKV
tara:strand:+ start:754 stop:1137 length:384 start_codon:yes stop_codon:yes gene_type:complete